MINLPRKSTFRQQDSKQFGLELDLYLIIAIKLKAIASMRLKLPYQGKINLIKPVQIITHNIANLISILHIGNEPNIPHIANVTNLQIKLPHRNLLSFNHHQQGNVQSVSSIPVND